MRGSVFVRGQRRVRLSMAIVGNTCIAVLTMLHGGGEVVLVGVSGAHV